ncbi:MAG: hypothetical protein G3M70_04795 [Candidatus Nitronauta litoralis]|uniref:Flagellar hook-length control protein-like C-terminal domain-containing protein n=1 Tax=Candidatus Nitronauta litoralis TaxID=2705533 RepID=A0A7T0BUL1_9BACT|nr:MAG: hypothetical protein G3M70_04795 [Candidatus Nitronauta litoralis]
MNNPSQIQFPLLAPQKAVDSPDRLIKPDKQGQPKFDHYLDREVNQPHLERSTRKERASDTKPRDVERSERLNDTLARSRESQHPAETTNNTRPETQPREAVGNPETGPAIASAKAKLPEEHRALGTGEKPASPEEKLVKALKDLNLDQERIDTILSTIKQGPNAEDVIKALGGLLSQLANVEGLADAATKSGAGKGEDPLKTLASLFQQKTSLTDTATKSGEQQLKLQGILEEAGLSPEEAKKLLASARQGNVSKDFNELKTQIARATEDKNLVKEGPANSLENKSLNQLLGGRLQNANASTGQETATNLAQQAATNPLLAKSPAVALQFVSNTPQTGGLHAQPLTDSGSTQPISSVSEASSRTTETVRVNNPANVTPRGLVEKPIAQQIIDKFAIRGAGQQKEIFIKLDPPSLGTVRMNVSTSGENVKTTLVAENQVVKQTIESNLTQLKDALNTQGIKVDSFTVLVGGNQGQPMPHQRHEGQSQARFFGSQHGNELNLNLVPEDIPPGRSPVFIHPSQSISLFA